MFYNSPKKDGNGRQSNYKHILCYIKYKKIISKYVDCNPTMKKDNISWNILALYFDFNKLEKVLKRLYLGKNDQCFFLFWTIKYR